ncbi:MAG: shikimate kinase [Fusicatenibacter sp.]|nr:shikimate kinase [Lachnospiraceae bacterium]MDY2939258.1 shikimate kinase [Fusicatenibacter sp.]
MNEKRNYNIVLIGFMGSGKSSVARGLSHLCGMEIIEMDEIISQREHMPITEIFAQKGETYFRDLETNLLIEMQSRTNCIISCGGGVPLRERNVAEMKKNGKVFCLTAEPSTILARTRSNQDRPLLKGRSTEESIRELMEQRREKYQAASDITIKTDDRSIPEICQEILSYLKEG